MGFAPPAPFTMAELDPAGALPERPYTKDEVLAYLAYARQKGQILLGGLTQERARQPLDPPWAKGKDFTYLELQLYNLRHVQEHAAQLLLSGEHLILLAPAGSHVRRMTLTAQQRPQSKQPIGPRALQNMFSAWGRQRWRWSSTDWASAIAGCISYCSLTIKPVEHPLGAGIAAEDLNDDCLGRTLDWLSAHDVTRLFAGLALRARRAFGIAVGRLHAEHDLVLRPWALCA